MRDLTQALAEWLAAGGLEVGEVRISEKKGAGFLLRHRADGGRADLEAFAGAEAARALALADAAGNFRPLKTAPNLRRGWQLALADRRELRRALDYFYPAMLGVWLSHRLGELPAVPLRATLGRQSGLYRVTQKITDAQAQRMIGGFCRSDTGCLKRILWPLAPGVPVTSLPAEKFSPASPPETLPLLCHEACNLLVARAREVVKSGENPS